MYRYKITVTALALTFFLLFSLNVFGDVTKDGGISVLADITSGPLRSLCEGCPNYPPEFEPPTQESFSICQGSTIYDTIVVTDIDDWQTLSLSLYSGPGTLTYTPSVSPANGYYEYMPAEEGTFDVVFVATDNESEPVYFTKTYVIYFNRSPIITNGGMIEKVAIIGEELNYDVDATDAEDDPIAFSLISGDGSIDANTGMLTFTPADYGIYEFEVEVSDSCGADTSLVTFDVILGFVLDCPPSSATEFICQPDTLCYPIGGIPEAADVTVEPSSAWFDRDINSICFYTNCSVIKDIKVIVSTENSKCDDCPPVDLDSCMFTVDVTLNSIPIVILPEDQSFWLCDPAEVCVPVGIDDNDDNLTDITVEVSPGGYFGNYSDITGMACFTPPATGVYEMIVTAWDECEAYDVDTINLDVTINTAPTATCSSVQELLVCDLSLVTLSGFVCDDIDGNLVSCMVDNGTLSGNDVTFTPVEGENIITLTATDECGEVTTCQTTVMVTLNSPPTAVCSDIQDLLVCDLSPVTLSGFVCDDIDGNLVNCEIDNGTLTDNDVTFTPVEGENVITLTATDECGVSTICQTIINVALNRAPYVACPPSEDLFVCDLSPITISGFSYIDPDGNMVSAEVNNGELVGGDVTFTPVEGSNNITITITDECGETAKCYTNIMVTLNSAPTASCPPHQELFVCDLSDITIGGFQYEDIDGNIFIAEVDNGTLNGSEVTFTPVNGENLITLTVTDECGETSTCQASVIVTLNSPPTATCPQVNIRALCDLSPHTISGFICDDIDDNLVSCEVDNGALIGDEVTFTPIEGENIITLTATDECGEVTTCQTIFNIVLDVAPTATVPDDQEIFVCDLSPITLDGFICEDRYANLVSCEVDNGTLEGTEVTFTPVVGDNTITLTATDECGNTASNSVVITVTLNNAPTATCPGDQEMFLCDLSEITIPGFVCDDIDGNLVSCEVNNGSLVEDAVTFIPVAGENIITLTATDECGAVVTCQTIITVILNSAPTATCPGDLELFVCDLSEICIDGFICDDIDANLINCDVTGGYFVGQPGRTTISKDGSAVSIESILNVTETNTGDATTPVGETVCFIPVEGTNVITLTATDDCGLETTCQTTVTVTLNNAPTASVPEPDELFVCDLSEITIPGFICDDIDGNLISCEVDNGSLSGDMVSFIPVLGQNTITLTATDECGIVTTNQTTINITMNGAPTVTCPEDLQLQVCDLSPITISGFYVDDTNGNLTFVGVNTGDLVEDMVTFTPVEGENIIILTARDECGEEVTCQTIVNVTLNSAPVVTCPPTQNLLVCDLSSVTLSGFLYEDVDGNIITADVDNGILSGNDVTFIPVEGENIITLTVTDECGEIVTCQTTVNIILNNAPTATTPANQELYLCDLSPITLDGFICNDIDGNLASCEVNNGTINGTEVIFTPVVGNNVIILTATDECGETATSEFSVEVEVAPTFELVCPGDVTKFICGPETLSYPIGGIPFGATVTVTPSSAWFDAETNEVGFYTNCSVEKEIVVTVETDCFTEVCQFTSSVTMNSNPLVVLSPDESHFLCEPAEICFPVGINDIDYNLAEVTIDVQPFDPNAPAASYNEISGKICFTPTTTDKYVVYVTATDECDSSATDSIVIDVVIDSAPTVSCPQDQQLMVCDLSDITISGFVCDDIDGNLISCEVDNGTLIDGSVIFTPVEGENLITLTATNECGKVTSCQTTIMVTLNSAPVVECPVAQDLFVCDLSPITLSGFIYNDVDGNLASYEVDNGTLTGNDVTFTPVVGENVITMTVTDECGAVTACQTIINVTLNTAPTATCPTVAEQFVCDLSPINVAGFVFDDIDGNIVTAGVDNGDLVEGSVIFNPIEGENTITLTVTDECGEIATCQTTIMVTLNTAPAVICPENKTVFACDLSELTIPGFFWNDKDANIASVEVDNGVLIGNNVTFTPVVGENIITFTVTDECGEIASCQAIVMVTLNSAPTVICPTDENLFVCDLSEITIPGFSWDDIDGNLIYTDVDNGLLVGHDVIFTPVVGKNIITFTATDDCGVATNCQTIITVNMNNAPTATCPETQDLFVCDLSDITIPGFSWDDVDGNLIYTEVDNGSLIGHEVVFTPVIGENTITLTVTDECGETATCQTIINVSLNNPPTATCVADQQLEVCDLSPITLRGFICDDIDGNLINCEVDNGELIEDAVTFTPVEGDNFITLTATDECGERVTCQTLITVTLNSAPTVTCPGDQTLFVCDLSPISIPGFNCDDIDGNLVSCEVNNGNKEEDVVTFTPVVGENIITLTATDECGEITTCQTIIIVNLNSAPTATCPGDQELFVCDLSAITLGAFFYDDIDGNLVSYDVDNGLLSGNEVTFTPVAGVNTITLTATDECGEVTTCQTTITVTLNSAPTATCPGDMEKFVCDLSPITLSGFYYDDIDGNLATYEVDNGILNGNEVTFTPIVGENVITLTTIDECGEEANCHVTITVALNSVPTATCPGDQALFVCDLSPITLSGFICDDVDGNLVTCEIDNGTIVDGTVTFTPVVGENIITLIATDECGLINSCQTIISVGLNSPPTASTPEDIQTVACDLSPITIDGFVCDDIDGNLVSCETNFGTLNGTELTFTPVEGLNTIILTATDECGLIATSEFNITVEVTPGFELTCPQSSTIFICEPATLRYPIGGIPEGATVTVVPSSAWFDAATGKVGFYTNCSVVRDIEVYVETECHTEVCQFTVTAIMNSSPLVISVPDTTMTVCENESACIPAGITDIDDNIISITVTDKATGDPIGSYDPISGGICFTPEVSGEYELILEAIDECGAKDADTSRINVTINSAPTATCPGDMELFVCDLSAITLSGFICDDIDGNLVICEVDNGTLTDNAVTFTPVVGLNTIKLTAIDACDDTVTCVSNITITLNSAPTTSTPDDKEMFVCDLSDITLTGFICDDVDGNLVSCEVDNGTLNGNDVTFTPVAGTNTITLTATDECGETSISETIITITLNSAPTVTCAESYEIFVCDLSDITLTGFSCDDVDGNLVSCEVDKGVLTDGEVIFTPVDGINEITLTTTDECGATTSCVTTITVTLNSPPTITAPENQDIMVCDLSEICLDGFSCDDVDDNIVSCEITGATLEGTTACFIPVIGENIISMTTTDECGETASRDIIFNVIMSQIPEIVDPGNQFELLCEAGPVCTDIVIIPPEAVVTVTALFGEATIEGTFEDNRVCFQADAEGIYTVTVFAETLCGTASVTYTVDVEFNVAPVINAGPDFELFQCEFVEYCFMPDLLEDANDNIISVDVSYNGFYNETTGEICFLPTGVGEYCLEITVTDDCQLTASDIICITVTSGVAAVIDCPTGPIDTLICDPAEMCISLPITPATAQVTVSQGTYDIATGKLCFDANYAGTYVIDVNAEDACGSDYCQVTVNVLFGDSAKITCPDLPVSASLCEAGMVSVFLPIEPDTAHVTVSPFGTYNPDTDELTFQANASGLYEFTVTAEAPCQTVECDIQVNVAIEQAPQITCPDDIERTVCLPTTDEICFPLEITGSAAEVTISPNGSYVDGVVCIPIDDAGTYPIEITATNFCGTSTCDDLNIIVYEDMAPTLTVPEDRIISSCTDVMEEICIDGIYGSDPDSDEFTIQKISGPGTYISAEADSGSVCFIPESNDITYTFVIELFDGCHTIVESFDVTIYPSNVCETCLEVALETDTCYIVGSTVPVHVTVNAIEEIGGFDLLIYYDASVMAFLSIGQGDAISEWEYLTYSHESITCGGACPTGMIRIIGIADRTIPMTHPPQEQLTPSGIMVTMNMRISRDWNIGGLFLPMGFYWFDCGDNTFSDPTGNLLYMDGIILDAFGGVVWDEADEDLFPEGNRQLGIGAPDSCLAGDKLTPVRCVSFKNGGICVIHPDDIDDRGDLNLNGVAYEIADAVVYTNYFIHGFAAFLINIDGQTAASEINRDGIPLTVADLVYLIRILTGDVPPSPKVAPPGSAVKIMTQIENNNLSVKSDVNYPTGAGLLVFEYSDAVPEMPSLGSVASDMDIVYNITDSEIRVLIYSFDLDKKIDVGQGDLLNLNFRGNGSIRLTETYFAGYYGELLKTEIVNGLLPGDFVLSQNYPNPFNPSTTINLTVPIACDWKIDIFNTAGQVVRTYDGVTEPGTVSIVWDGLNYNRQSVATGIYFYRVKAADYTETRKMILLK